jgi:hypothetical protein
MSCTKIISSINYCLTKLNSINRCLDQIIDTENLCSSVSVVSRPRVRRQGFDRRELRPRILPVLLYEGYRVFIYADSKAAGAWPDRPLLSNAGVQNIWNCTFTVAHIIMTSCVTEPKGNIDVESSRNVMAQVTHGRRSEGETTFLSQERGFFCYPEWPNMLLIQAGNGCSLPGGKSAGS